MAGLRRGKGCSLFVVGEAGLGKTALLDYARASAGSRVTVASARGDEMEGMVAFGLATQAFGVAVPGALEALAPRKPGVLKPAAPYYALLRRLQERTGAPLLVLFDDLHWSDVDSLNLIAFLSRRLAALEMAIVGTLRPWPSGALEVCGRLAGAGDAGLERLAPLSRAASEELLAQRSATPVSEADAERAWQLCQGNPLLIEQVAHALDRGERVPAGDPNQAPISDHLLLPRFAGLDERGLACARAAAVLGTSFRLEVAADMAGIEEPAIDTVLDALSRSGLVEEAGGGETRFVHPLFAQALYDDLVPPVRRRLHSRAFSALVERGLDEEAAEHAIRAELVGDDRAIELLSRTGRRALAAGAVGAATRQLEAAVRLSGARAPLELQLVLCEALTSSGRSADAVVASRRLLDEPELPWKDRVDVLRMLGRALYLSGAPSLADGALAQAVAIATERDPAMAIQPLLDQSLSAWLSGGPAQALPLVERAREIASRHGSAELRERAETAWGHMALESGDPDGAAAGVGAAWRTEAGAPPGSLDPADLMWPWASVYHYAITCNYLEHHDEAERAFVAAREVVDRAGAADAHGTLSVYIAHLAIRRGRLAAAVAEAERAVEFADLTPAVVPYALLARSEALLWAGRLEESEQLCLQAERLGHGQWFAELWAGHVRGLRMLWAGEVAASDEFLAIERLTLEQGIGEPCHVQWSDHAVAAHLAADREPDARRVVEWVDGCAARLSCRWPRIATALGRARLAEHRGDAAQAETFFRSAISLHEETDLPLLRCEAHMALGDLLRRSGRLAGARPPFAEAQRLAESCGAAELAKMATLKLRMTGGRRRRRDTAEERDVLTPAEERVADLASAGHSNAEIARRLFLSVNTVETHLKHVYAKLSISSRRDLMTLNRS